MCCPKKRYELYKEIKKEMPPSKEEDKEFLLE